MRSWTAAIPPCRRSPGSRSGWRRWRPTREPAGGCSSPWRTCSTAAVAPGSRSPSGRGAGGVRDHKEGALRGAPFFAGEFCLADPVAVRLDVGSVVIIAAVIALTVPMAVHLRGRGALVAAALAVPVRLDVGSLVVVVATLPVAVVFLGHSFFLLLGVPNANSDHMTARRTEIFPHVSKI